MKKGIKARKPVLKSKYKKHSKKKQAEPQILGLGSKIVNSILIGLNENDKSHVRKIVEGLDEYDLAKLIEVLDVDERKQLIEILGDHIDPGVFPELNEVVQEQVIESLDENQIAVVGDDLSLGSRLWRTESRKDVEDVFERMAYRVADQEGDTFLYDPDKKKGQMLEFAVPVRSADVPQTQGTILATISLREISATMGELEWMGMVILSIIVILSIPKPVSTFFCFSFVYFPFSSL